MPRLSNKWNIVRGQQMNHIAAMRDFERVQDDDIESRAERVSIEIINGAWSIWKAWHPFGSKRKKAFEIEMTRALGKQCRY